MPRKQPEPGGGLARRVWHPVGRSSLSARRIVQISSRGVSNCLSAEGGKPHSQCCPWSPSSGKAANKDRSPCCCEPASASVGTSAGPDDASQVLHPAPQAPALQEIWSLADGETTIITSSWQHPNYLWNPCFWPAHTSSSVPYPPVHSANRLWIGEWMGGARMEQALTSQGGFV